MDTAVSPEIAAEGRMIRAIREGIGMPLTDFATAIGASATTLSRFETGQRRMSPDLIDRVGSFVGQRLAEASRART